MGNTGNSDTYPYGIQTVGKKDQVYNRITGEVVKEFDLYGVEASQHLNKLVFAFKRASDAEKKSILNLAKVAA